MGNEADFPSINIASGVEGDEVTEGIPDPYADQSPRIEVPELVYTQDPPYDPSVVEIGEKVFGEPFHEYTHAEEGEAVMGKEYEDVPFDKTINSVPEPNPSREWEVLDVQHTGMRCRRLLAAHVRILYAEKAWRVGGERVSLSLSLSLGVRGAGMPWHVLSLTLLSCRAMQYSAPVWCQ